MRGLGVGAPVELHGIKIGQVTDVRLQYDAKSDQITVPVRYDVEPQRIADSHLVPASQVKDYIGQAVEHGLRAQLGTASFVTGQKLITLDVVGHAAPAEIHMEGDAIVLPTAPGGFDNITEAASQVLAKVDAIPFEQIGANLNDTLKSVSQIANGSESGDSLTALHATLVSTQKVMTQLNAGLQPAVKQLPAIASGLEETVARTNKLVGSLHQTYSGNSAFNRDLERLMAQLSERPRRCACLRTC